MEKRGNWPSDRIPRGGIFHTPKINYSKATQEMLEALMKESKVTMMQRNKINYFLRNGECLPQPKVQKRAVASEEYEIRRAREILCRSRVARKRPLDIILQSGDYEREKFVPRINLRNNEQSKKQLQEIMSGLSEYPELLNMKLKPKDKYHKYEEDLYNEDRIAEILNEIYERIDWLNEMEELGESKKHKPIIYAEVSERLLEIKKIEKKMMEEEQKKRLEKP